MRRNDRALAQGAGRQHDAELVAAGARQHVAGPQPGLRHQGEMLQAGVAGGVAVGIVDHLEAVEIDHSSANASPRRSALAHSSLRRCSR